MDFHGKTAFITAGAHGMGRRVAHRMSEQGANIVIADLNAGLAAEVAAELPSAIGVGCDVRDSAQVEGARDAAFERFGQVDVVMSHAGITSAGPLQDFSDDDWTTILDLNVVGMARVLRAFIPHLIERGSGHVILTSSSLALIGGHPLSAFAAPYIASKAAVIGLAQATAVALSPHGVNVTVFAPDSTDTGFAAAPTRDAVAANVPVQGLVPVQKQTPEHAADVLMDGLDQGRFLASATPDFQRLLELQAEALLDPSALASSYTRPAQKTA